MGGATQKSLDDYKARVMLVTYDTWDDADDIIEQAYVDEILTDSELKELRRFTKRRLGELCLREVPKICTSFDRTLAMLEESISRRSKKMLGGGPYQCETCPKCGENDMWNGKCASCGYEKPDEEDEEGDAVSDAPGGLIDSLDGVKLDRLRYENIRIVYATHGEERSVYEEQEDGSKRLVKFDYRKGYLTPIGDIDRDVWQQIAETLIMRSYEGWITDSLQEWYIAHPPNDSGVDMSWRLALKAHIHRDYDRPAWIYYIPWNRLYRPGALQGKLFPTVVAPCCGVAGETTAELLRMERRELFGYCPCCFKRSSLRLINDPGNSRRALMREDDGEAA